MTEQALNGGHEPQPLKLPLVDYELLASQCQTTEKLRSTVLRARRSELAARFQANPMPTDEEARAGALREQIEPQAVEAVFDARVKGYNVGSSGFGGPRGSDRQVLVFHGAALSADTKSALATQGFSVNDDPVKGRDGTRRPGLFSRTIKDRTVISFVPTRPTDFAAIKAQWNQLAALLPDLGAPAPPSMSTEAQAFREAVKADNLETYIFTRIYRAPA